MTGDRREVELVKAGLKDRIGELCARLLPDGRPDGRLFVAHNPRTGDAASHPKEPALKVALDGDVGAWICWRSGDKGDVMGLIGHCMGLDFAGAMAFGRDFLGLKRMDNRQRADFSAEIERRKGDREALARKKAADKRKAVRKLWDGAVPIDGLGPDGAAALLVHRYLALGRGTPIGNVRRRDPATLRVAPAMEWWKGATWSNAGGQRRKTAPGPEFPAIVSAFRSATGLLTAVHCTFLDPVKPQKAPVDQAKLMFGEALGSVIRISHGPEGLAPEDAREPHPLVLCEGLEDGLSLAIGLPECRVWAGGSLAGMGAAPVFLPCVSSVFVAADNEWTNRQATAQFERVLAALEDHGKPVEVMRSAVGKDFNDGMKPEQGE